MSDVLQFAYPLVVGILLGVVGIQSYVLYRRNEKVRVLRGLVRGVDRLANVGQNGEDPVAVAKRKAEEDVLLSQFKQAVTELK